MGKFKRVFQNKVSVDPEGNGVLEIIHPTDGRHYTRLFDGNTECLDFVEHHHWSPNSRGHYARTCLSRDNFLLLHHLPFYMQGIEIKGEVDHVDGEYDDRMENLVIVSHRGARLNMVSNREIPHLYYSSKWDSYRPQININGSRMYSPGIKDYDTALSVAEMFGVVAWLYDSGKIPHVTNEQLRRLVDKIRGNPSIDIDGLIRVSWSLD